MKQNNSVTLLSLLSNIGELLIALSKLVMDITLEYLEKIMRFVLDFVKEGQSEKNESVERSKFISKTMEKDFEEKSNTNNEGIWNGGGVSKNIIYDGMYSEEDRKGRGLDNDNS